MQVKRERMDVDGREAITVSQLCEGGVGNLTNRQFNALVSSLLSRLASELANEDEYEFDFVEELRCSLDDRISLTMNLFVP